MEKVAGDDDEEWVVLGYQDRRVIGDDEVREGWHEFWDEGERWGMRA